MKYIKISLIIIVIISFFYYQLKENNNDLFEDKLSMFILIKSHNNIDDILFDLSSQIKSFDDYVYNVHYKRDNNFLIKNKIKLQFDHKYINYGSLLNSSDIVDFNIRVSKIIENYFLDHNSEMHLTKRYLLRDFLVRFYDYIEKQSKLFHMKNSSGDAVSLIEDFIVGPKYISDYKKDFYIMRIEFLDFNAIINYESDGLDSIFNSILNYNSKIFNSEATLYNPHKDNISNNKFDFELIQYVKEFSSIEEAINYHENLMLSENIFLVESVFDYYYSNTDSNAEKHVDRSLKLNTKTSDSNHQINQEDYRNSLLLLEEKLIALQSDDLTDDQVIINVLHDLIGDGNNRGLYSEYIDLINLDTRYIVENMNKIFSNELKFLLNKINQSKDSFNYHEISPDIRDHLYKDSLFKVRYFVD